MHKYWAYQYLCTFIQAISFIILHKIAWVMTFSSSDIQEITKLNATLIISRGINQQCASAYLPDTVSIYENGDAIGSRLIFLTELGLGSSLSRVPWTWIPISGYFTSSSRVSIIHLYNSRDSMNSTFQDFPSASYAFLPSIIPSTPSRQTAPSLLSTRHIPFADPHKLYEPRR